MSSKLSLSALGKSVSGVAMAIVSGGRQLLSYVKSDTSPFPRRRESITGVLVYYASLLKPNTQVMDSRLRGNDGAFLVYWRNCMSTCYCRNPHIGILYRPTLPHETRPLTIHLLRCSPYIYVNFVNLSRFPRSFTLAEIGVSRHRLNHV